jgi:hypothetical protein
MPMFILMVILNFAILAVLIDFLASVPLIPPALRGTNRAAVPERRAGLILLAAGRYAADNVQASELVDQGRHLGGFWVGIYQSFMNHSSAVH